MWTDRQTYDWRDDSPKIAQNRKEISSLLEKQALLDIGNRGVWSAQVAKRCSSWLEAGLSAERVVHERWRCG